MSDTTEPTDEHAAVDDAGPGDDVAPGDEAGPGDDRPGRPPLVRFFEALGVRRHARVGVLSGLVLAVVLFGFFVVLPSVVPGVRGRTESTVLFLVLGFVVAVTTALFVTTALTARTLFRQVASPPKWVRRGGGLAVFGGGCWAAATVAAVAGAADLIRPWIAVPVLLVFPGIWAVHTRVKRLDSDLDRLGTVAAVAGAVAVHGAAILEPGPFLGAPFEAGPTPFTASVAALAGGTFLLSLAARTELDAAASVAAATSGVGLATVAMGLAGVATVSGAFAAVLIALAWAVLGVGLRRSPRPVGWTPDEEPSLFEETG